MKVRLGIFFPLIATIVLTVSTISSGTTLLAFDLESLTRFSDQICTGRVVDSTAFLRDGRIYTLNRIEIIEEVKGRKGSGEIIEVITAGGHSELFSQKVFGAAELEKETTYLFFLENRGIPEAVHPVGMTQGAVPVILDAETRVTRVHPPKFLPRLLTRNPIDGRFQSGIPWITEPRLLNEVLEQIRTFVGGDR